MRKLIVAGLCILLMGCGGRWEVKEQDDNGKTVAMGINVIVVNGCQYVLWRKVQSAAIVHAGNCNNPIHNQKPSP